MNGIGGNLLNSVTGMTEKACIVIENKAPAEKKIQHINTIQKNAQGSFGAVSLRDKRAMSAVLSSVGKLEGIVNAAKSVGLLERENVFTVDFNPASLKISAIGGGNYSKSNMEEKKLNVDFEAVEPTINISMTLIFDDSCAHPSPANSVQRKAEAFIAALRNPDTRGLRFYWGKMCYCGIVNRLNCSYTMFSVFGKPLRAEVTIGMVSDDFDAQGEKMGMWQRAYEKVFAPENINLANLAGSSLTSKAMSTKVGSRVANVFK